MDEISYKKYYQKQFIYAYKKLKYILQIMCSYIHPFQIQINGIVIFKTFFMCLKITPLSS